MKCSRVRRVIDISLARVSNLFWVALFFFMMIVWAAMIYYTIVPWLIAYTLPVNSDTDISALTWVFVGLSMISTALWFFMQVGFLVIGDRMTTYQQRAIANSNANFDVKETPLVSIVIPARNEEAVIKRTISTCLSQTYENIEVVVICHNCTDKTYLFASQLGDKRVRAFDFKTKQAGKGLALDFAAEQAAGKYILVLDSDGILSSNFIETALPLFDSLNIAAVQGKLLSSNRNYNIITRILALEIDLYSIPFMTVKSLIDRRTPLGGTGYIVRKDILQAVGGFGNSLIDDFELSFRLFRNKYRIAFAPLSVEYDEKPPELALMIRQRSRWVKGHIDLLRVRVAEPTDIAGNIYWLNPIFMIGGFFAIGIVSFGIANYILFGNMPYRFSFIPIKIWLGMTVVNYFMQLAILVRQNGLKGLRQAGNLLIMPPFSQYWYVTLVKAFFVKSWATTKTTHGFYCQREEVVRIAKEPEVNEDGRKERT